MADNNQQDQDFPQQDKTSQASSESSVQETSESLSAQHVLNRLEELFSPENTQTQATSQAQAVSETSQAPVQSETASSPSPHPASVQEASQDAYDHYYDPARGRFVRRKKMANAEADKVNTSDKANNAAEQQAEVSVTSSQPQKEEAAEPVAKAQKERPLRRSGNPKKEKKQASLARRIARRIIITLLVLIVLGGGAVGYYVYDALQPVDSRSTDYVQVEIPEGAGTRLIGQTLEKAGVIKSASIFNYYTKFRNYSGFAAGYYNLQKSMNMDQIVQSLQAGGSSEPTAPVSGKVTIPEGYTITQIAQAITDNSNTKDTSDKTPFSSDEFLRVVQDDSFINHMKEKYPRLLANLPDKSSVKYVLEGYLFPATYNYYDGTTLEELIEQMIAATDSQLSDYYDTIASNNQTVHDVLTLASIVEKEGNTDDDRRQIASVFYNRMNSGMALQSNVPLLYASDKLGTTTTLAEDANVDTNMDSPYNDYTHEGLPPGPVDNPGISAIRAVISPDSTDYLYFVADVDTGTVYYSRTYEEHEANVERYVNSKLTSSSSSSN